MTAPRGPALSLVAVGLALAAPLLYVATLDHAYLRRSGVLMFGLLGLAVAAAGRARAHRRAGSRVAAVATLVVTSVCAAWFFWGARLPGDRAPAVGGSVPLFTATAHDGSRFELAAALAKGPVLLVFYRGFW